jgi:hypothetical protein
MNLKRIFAGLTSLVLALSPMSVYADEETSVDQEVSVVAQSVDGTREYNDYSSAWAAANSGTEIIMLQDWILTDRLVVNEGQSVTIDMNGHKIDRNLSSSQSDGEVIYMNKKSNLTLKSSVSAKFSIRNYLNDEKGRYYRDETIGGMITGGASTNGGGGIHMKGGSKLTLDYVGVMGNAATTFSGSGGGIHTDGHDCEINLKNQSQVSFNYALRSGGGVYISSEDNYITMDNSQISCNYSTKGGGIFSDDDATRIIMNNHSHMTSNRCEEKGGAIYFNDSYNLLKSDDSTGLINSNYVYGSLTTYGGAIYYAGSWTSDNQGEIQNIQFQGNQVDANAEDIGCGGAIYCDMKNLTITNCTFNSNMADDGGAVYANAKNMILDGCTIEGNSATSKGAGVFVYHEVDINLAGKLSIKNNHEWRAKNCMDIYLDTDTWATAYISGTPEKGSEVGILGIGEGKVAINQTANNGCFFLNESDRYHLEYSGSEIYEKSGTTSSVFGNGNTLIAACVMVGIGVVGVVVLVVNKKKKKNT